MHKLLVMGCFLAISLSSAFANNKPFVETSSDVHQVKVFNMGSTALWVRLDMIERAQESIELEYFIYDTDPSARILTQALIKKAQEGVKVRVLLDAFMVKPQITPHHIHFLKQQGVEVKYFHNTSVWRFVKFQYRSHRKLLSIDNKEAIIGGRNISDEYFDLQHEYNFVDQDIHIKGPLVDTIVASFDEFWNHELSSVPKKPKMPNIRDFAYRVRSDKDFDWSERVDPYDRFVARAFKSFENDLKSWSKKSREAYKFIVENDNDRKLREEINKIALENWDKEPEGTCSEATFVSDEPGWGRKYRKRKHLNFFMLEKMKQVEKSLIIDSPYFIPERKFKKVLKKLLKDEKEITVFTNSLHSTDAIYVNSAFNTVVKKYLKRGLVAHLFKGQAMEEYPILHDEVRKARWGTHSKAYLFDDKELTIGTYNFDARSGIWNMEMSFFCKANPELVDAFKRNIEWKKQYAHQIENKKDLKKVKFQNISFGKGLLYYIMKPLSLLLRNLL